MFLPFFIAGCAPQRPPDAGVRGAAARVLVMDFEKVEATESSAFSVGPDLFATCAHVLRGGEPLGLLLPDGTPAPFVEIVAADDASDLAVLRVEGSGLAPLPLSRRRVAIGAKLHALTRQGVTPARMRRYVQDPELGEVLEFSGPGLGPGASGGALLNRAGQVVGVIVGGVDDDPEQCHAVPAARLTELLKVADHRP